MSVNFSSSSVIRSTEKWPCSIRAQLGSRFSGARARSVGIQSKIVRAGAVAQRRLEDVDAHGPVDGREQRAQPVAVEVLQAQPTLLHGVEAGERRLRLTACREVGDQVGHRVVGTGP